jgi:NAD(P)-dependent dehydrogenase (short-subunit alcohol dehydrogenase family)
VAPNVGVGWLTPLGQITEEDYDTIFCTNVKGAIFTVQKALPLLGAGASAILNGAQLRGTIDVCSAALSRRVRRKSALA